MGHTLTHTDLSSLLGVVDMLRTRLALNGAVNGNCSRDYNAALLDAAIIAGFTFFSTLAGIGVVLGFTVQGIEGCIIATGVSFFGSLMASLGISKPAKATS